MYVFSSDLVRIKQAPPFIRARKEESSSTGGLMFVVNGKLLAICKSLKCTLNYLIHVCDIKNSTSRCHGQPDPNQC